MSLPTTEKTTAQSVGWFNRVGQWSASTTGWGWGWRPEVKAVHGSGAEEGHNRYDVSPWVTASCGGVHSGFIYPGTFEVYRSMDADPAIAIAKAAVVLSILAAEWLVEVDDDLTEDETAQFAKEIVEQELIAKRSESLREMLDCLSLGFQAFECVYGEKITKGGRPYTGLIKLKALLQEWTVALVDKQGNLLGAKNGQDELRGPKLLWIVYDKKHGNWYGRARNENCRRAWSNGLTLEDRKMMLVRLGTGIIIKVLYPPDTEEDKAAGRFPNRDAALNLANAASEGRNVVAENFTGLDAQQVIGNPDLAGKSNITIEVIDVGDPGPRLSAIGIEQDRSVKDRVRGWLQPERTITEATMGGSRADSESHGDIALADAEATHELVVGQVNDQLVTPLIRENCGEKYVGRIRLVAAPIQDEQKRQLSAIHAALLNDSQYLASFVDSIGDEGIQGIQDRLGTGIKLAEPFNPLVSDEPEPTAPVAVEANDNDEN